MSMILTSSTLLVQFQNQIKSLEKSRLLNLATSLATLIVSQIKIVPINDVTNPNRPTRDQAMRIRIGSAPQEGGAIGIDRRSNNVNS
jgi:predicted nucleic acid-binding protein